MTSTRLAKWTASTALWTLAAFGLRPTRDLVWPMCRVWQRLMKATAVHRRVLSVLKLQVQIQEVLHGHSEETFLPTDVSKRFTSLVNTFLKEYTLLVNWADGQNKLLFSCSVKFHYFHHLGARAAFLNPRKGNTMVDEDFAGQCKHLVAACAHGTKAQVVPLKFAERYCWGTYIILMYGP